MTALRIASQSACWFCMLLCLVTGSSLMAESAGPGPIDVAAPGNALLDYGGVISGVVTQLDGTTPITDVTVSAYRPDGTFVAQTHTWDDGLYWLVVPAGEYVLDARGAAGTLFHPVTYDNLPGTISTGSNLSQATHAVVPASEIVGGKDFRLPQGYGITVVSPNGGESWTAGNTVTVTWTSAGISPDLQVLTLIRKGADGPGAIRLGMVNDSLPTVGDAQTTFSLPTWLGNGTDYFVELWVGVGYYSIGASDLSDGPFSITGSGPAKSIEVTDPTAQTSWSAGTTQNITWTSTGVTTVEVVEVFDNQSMVAMAGTGLPAASQQFAWSIQGNIGNGTHYSVLLIGDMGEQFAPFDRSPEFEIVDSDPRPTMTITSPNGGESWPAGSTQSICWTSSESSVSVQTAIMRSGGVVTGIGYASVPTGCTSGPLCPYIGDGNDYLALAIGQTANGLVISDVSDATFSVTDSSPAPTIQVTSPNGGEELTAGQTYAITWTAANAAGENANVFIQDESSKTTGYLGTVPAEAGTFNWTICPYAPGGSQYRIILQGVTQGCPDFQDSSDGLFTIAGTQPAPTVHVTSPNGGETFTAGQNVTITWDSSNAADKRVVLQLMQELGGYQSYVSYIGEAAADAGTFDWQICPWIGDASNYKILVSIQADTPCPTISDLSDAAFTITGSQPTPTIQVTSPNGGETFTAGQNVTITWDSSNAAGKQVVLELMQELGGYQSYVSYIGEAAADAGTFDWQICPWIGDASNYKIQASIQDESSCPYISDLSDAAFTITDSQPAPTIQVTSPNGGETFAVGTTMSIQWNTSAVTGYVCIDLYRDGSPYQGVGCVPATDYGFACYLSPDLESGSGYTINIRLDLVGCGSYDISDQSDGPFTIAVPSISGTIRDTGGTPLKGVLVEAQAQQPGGPGEYTCAYAVTGQDGTYRLIGVPPGDYRLRAGGELDAWAIEAAIQDPVSGHWYERANWVFGYDNSEGLCEARGGYMATISSQDENDWIWNNIPGIEQCTLGGTDRAVEGVWLWPNGEPFTYTNWATGEPNDSWGNEDYLSLQMPDGQWNDVPNVGQFLCEYDSPPDYLANHARRYYPDTPYSNEGQVIALAATAELTGYDFTLAAGSEVTGHIRTADGSPIGGVTVEMWPSQWQQGVDVGFQTTSGTDGSYRFRNLPTGAYYMMASSPSCTPAYVPKYYDNKSAWQDRDELTISAPQSVNGVDFTLEVAGSLSLSGRVLAAGIGVENAWVSVSNQLSFWANGQTDENGYYYICGLPPGDYTVYVQPYSRESVHYSGEIYNDRTTWDEADIVPVTTDVTDINFDLDPAGTIQGTVYDQDTGQPLSGSSIDLFVWDGTNEHGTAFGVSTDAFGHYVAIAKPATYLVKAHRTGYVQEYYEGVFSPDSATPLVVVAGEDLTGKDIYLNPAYDISGHVTKTGTSEPLSGVSLLAVPEPPVPGVSSVGISDGAGDFTIEDLPNGTYAVTASATGYYRRILSVTITGADVTGLNVVLVPAPASDVDEDEDVDLIDFAHFRSCYNGDNRPPAHPECDDMDFNGDNDVDLIDFSVFRSCFNGSNRPPKCT